MDLYNILIVDDEEAVLRFVGNLVEEAGYRTLRAGNLTDGDRLASEEKFALAIIDIALPDGSGLVRVSESNRYDPASQINTIILFYSLPDRTEDHVETLSMRIYYPQELDELLTYNGFAIDAKYGDYNRSPFQSSSPRQLVVTHPSTQARGIDKTQRG